MRLMIAYDGSSCADAALDDLRRAGLPDEAEAMLITITETWLPPPSGLELLMPGLVTSINERAEETRLLLGRATERLKNRFPGWEVITIADTGSPAATLLHHAEQWNPDMIVVGSHGFSKVQRFFIGSVSQRMAADAHCSVRIARGRLEEIEEAPVRIVVGVDGSIDSDMTIYVVAHRHWPPGTEVRLVTSIGPLVSTHSVVTYDEEKEMVEKMHGHAAEKLREAGLAVSSVMSFEDPKHAVVNEAESWGADCIFVGSRGLGRLGRFLLGSVSGAIAARAHCSVEIVRRTSTAIWPEEVEANEA